MAFEKRRFQGRKARRQPKKARYYAFDIESWGLNPNNPVILAVVPFKKYTRNTPEKWVFHNKEEMIEWLDSLPITKRNIIYAHNGSKFDIYAIFETWDIIDSKKFDRDGRIYWIRYNQSVEFRDSFHLLNTNLKNLGAKGITPEKFINSEHPDYGNRDSITELDIEYCVQDCEVLRDALIDMQKLYSSWVGLDEAELPLTTASMSHRIWSHTSWPQEWMFEVVKGKNAGQIQWATTIDNRAEIIAQEAYYGGRTEILGEAGKEYERVLSLDRNSMYPSSMLLQFPDPTTYRQGFSLDYVRSQNKLYWGRFILKAGENAILFLPSINEEGRRDYKQTNFNGSLTSIEVEYALENGWEVVNYSDLWYSEKTIQPFSIFVEKFYNIRKNMKLENDGRHVLVKLMLNSLYGVFGTKGHLQRIESAEEINEIFDNPDWEKEWVEKAWGRHTDRFYLVSLEEDAPPEHTCFAWVSFITSYARVELDRAIRKIENWGHQVLYVDTDSVHFSEFVSMEKCPLKLGQDLGDWDIESVKLKDDSIRDFADSATYFEPKLYVWRVDGERVKTKHKGCNRSNGDPYKIQYNESVRHYRQSARQNKPSGEMVRVGKKSKRYFGKVKKQ